MPTFVLVVLALISLLVGALIEPPLARADLRGGLNAPDAVRAPPPAAAAVASSTAALPSKFESPESPQRLFKC